ncbi:hypothetical protein DMENIID0001_148580 [Sergentomyia squamirostris]
MDVQVDQDIDPDCPEMEYVEWLEEAEVEEIKESQINRLHGCQHCQEKFLFADDLRDHEAQYHRFSCEVCSKVMGTKEQLDFHTQAHTDPRSGKVRTAFHCDLCPMVFLEEIFLRNHKEKKHQLSMDMSIVKEDELDELWICDVCDKKFDTEDLYRQHLTVHEENQDSCLICTRKWRSYGEMMNHMKYHRKKINTNVAFHCSICNKSFKTREDLDIHYSQHTVDRKACEQCHKIFINKYHLDFHMDREHHPWKFANAEKNPQRNYAKFVCILCKQVKDDGQMLLSHAAYHGIFSCSICGVCGELLDDKDGLFEHFIETHRMRPKEADQYLNYRTSQSCRLEGNTLPKRIAKVKPVKAVKPKPKTKPSTILTPFKATVVKPFTAFKPYTGSIGKIICKRSGCNMTFLDLQQFNMHTESTHRIQKTEKLEEVSCQVCKETFPNLNFLTSHAFTHVSESFCNCGICGLTLMGPKSVEAHLTFGKCKPNPVKIEPKIFRKSPEMEKKASTACCPICSKIYYDKTCLYWHYQKSHPEKLIGITKANDKKPGYCCICNVVRNGMYMKSHASIHASKGDLTCGICGEVFYMKTSLNSHLEECHQVKVVEIKTSRSLVLPRVEENYQHSQKCIETDREVELESVQGSTGITGITSAVFEITEV